DVERPRFGHFPEAGEGTPGDPDAPPDNTRVQRGQRQRCQKQSPPPAARRIDRGHRKGRSSHGKTRRDRHRHCQKGRGRPTSTRPTTAVPEAEPTTSGAPHRPRSPEGPKQPRQDPSRPSPPLPEGSRPPHVNAAPSGHGPAPPGRRRPTPTRAGTCPAG